MTSHQDSTGIVALDELGHRFEVATARPRVRRLRPRRWPALALGVLVVAATPALASVSGIIGGPLSGPKNVEKTIPKTAGAIDRDDPKATGLALERRGFRVHWVLITDNPDPDGQSPTRSRDVSAPPAGTEILGLFDYERGNLVKKDTRELLIEVTPVGSEIAKTHL